MELTQPVPVQNKDQLTRNDLCFSVCLVQIVKVEMY